MNSDTCIAIFSKAPVDGEVKTRLAPAMTQQQSAQLYKTLVIHTLETTCAIPGVSIYLYCQPDCQHDFFTSCHERFHLELVPQVGKDLGERMDAAFRTLLMQHRRVILIGADCPVLDRQYLLAASNCLDEPESCVLGPAEDGGYVLIGLNRYENGLFSDIAWGSGTVAEETRTRIVSRGLKYHELATLWDVDRISDVHRLQREHVTLLGKAGQRQIFSS